MSTQQDIYAAGSESHPPMLNKENYVPWSSRLLRDINRDVPVNETFHVQTDDELTKKELKQIEADDQAIQTIILGLPKYIYAAVDTPHEDQPSYNQNYMQQPMPNLEDITYHTIAMNMALALMAKAFKLNYSKPTNNNQRILSNLCNRQISQPGMNMGQDRQMQIVGGCSESKSVGNKMHKAFPLLTIKFPLPEQLPTASEVGSHWVKKSEATARKIALLC
nr:hypothetical protein [Tanacetum cinerariifolium]